MLRTLRRKLMISHQFHRGWDCSAGYRGCSGTAGGKSAIGRNVAEIKFSHFCPSSIGTIIPKMHHLTLKGRSKIRVSDFLHKGRSIEIYNKQCWVLLFCKKSEFLGVHWSNWFVFLTYILDHFESSNKGKLGRDQLPEGRLLTPASRGNLKPMKNEIHCKLK